MESFWEIALGLALFAGAIGVGVTAWRNDRALQRERARAERLEAELVQVKERFESQRSQIEKHFARTSDLFHDLTEQYRALYAHLAEGARAFSPASKVPALGHGFGDPPIAPLSATTDPQAQSETRQEESR